MIPGYDPARDAGNCVFDKKLAHKAVRFFIDHLQLIEGEKANQPFKLEKWQKEIIENIFGWVNPDGTRRYREVFIFVARKNGKTPLAAGVVNYVGFCDGEPGAQIYSAAGDREQAALLFRHVSGMINKNSELASRSRIYRSLKSIEYYGGDGYYKVLSHEANTKEGFNTHCCVIDELHIIADRALVDVLTTSTASRRQPLMIYITTAGWDKHSICREKYDYAVKVRDGIIKDATFLPVIYEADKEDDWKSEEVWKKANPNLGVSISLEYLRKECIKAQQIPAYENTFRRYHLNQWTEQDVRWLSLQSWLDCESEYGEEDLEEESCYAGIDLSSTRDLSGIVLLFPGDKYRVLTYPFIPEENAREREEKDRVPYLTWARQGFIETTPGNVVDYSFIRKRLLGLRDRFNIQQVVIDRWNATQIATELQGDGFDVNFFGQGFASMSAPTKKLEELILSKRIQHNNHPVLNWCMSNVSVETDAAGNVKPSKKKSSERIDMAVCLIEAVGGSLLKPMEGESVYATRGILRL